MGSLPKLDATTVSENKAAINGGGIYCSIMGSPTIKNSTISKNTAAGLGGGLYMQQSGGFIINNSTIAENSLSGIYVINSTAAKLYHTIVAKNIGGSNCSGILPVTQNFNLDDDDSCNLTALNDNPGENADLGPLQDNGGPTFTHALGNASNALNNGDLTCGVIVDQRGFTRPVGGKCEIGSFEQQL